MNPNCSDMYKSLRWIAFLSCFLDFTAYAQQSTDPVLMTIGPKKVTVSEFMYHYKKNPVGADSLNENASLREYLPLFINYKLKVLAGESLGLDTTEAFREELAGYRKVSAQSFITDKNVTEALVKEAYERMKEEINASHILLEVASNASPDDTLRVYNQALSIRERILKGESFEELAKQFSKDPYAARNGGTLGWFTGLQMVYPFETAAYQTKKGDISMPVRTKFGYHLIRVNDRRTSQGNVQVAHLFVRVDPNATDAEKMTAKTKIEEAYGELQRGVPFEAVVKQFSEDASTKSAGGVMQPFGTGKMLPPFEEAAFALKKENAYSAPFQTQYGWHILKLVKRIPLLDYAEVGGYLRTKVQSDDRSNVSKSAVLRRVKQENKYEENKTAVAAALEKANPLLKDGKWQAPADANLNGQLLFRIGSQIYRVSDFYNYVQQNQRPQPGASPQSLMQSLLNAFIEEKNLEYEEQHLEAKNEDFRDLIQEYHDGMLLFQMLDEKVQGRSLTDTTGQRQFYEQNRNKYQLPPRVKATVLDAASRPILDLALKSLAKKPYALSRKVTDLTFPKGQTKLTEGQREQLFDLIVILTKNYDYQVEISGHADASEADSCSAGRLRSVVNELVKRGNISATRIVEVDESKFKPVSTTNRDKNRRVSFALFTNAPIDVVRQFNTQKADNLIYQEGFFQKGENKFVDAVSWKVGKQTVEKSGRVVQVDIQTVDNARTKTLNEARGQVINDYQVYLEKDWVESLKKQFPVQVNENELKKLK